MTIDKNLVRRGNRDKDLLKRLNSFTKDFRQSYDEGGPVKPVVPIDVGEYLELGAQIANMTEAQRENLKFMLEKLGPKKKWKRNILLILKLEPILI